MYTHNPYYGAYLSHHGIKGQRWGVRRYRPYAKGEKPAGGKEVGEAAKKSKERSNADIVKRADRKEVLDNYERLSINELQEARQRMTLLRDIDKVGYEYKHRNIKHTTDTLKAIGAVGVAGIALYGNADKTLKTGKELIKRFSKSSGGAISKIKNKVKKDSISSIIEEEKNKLSLIKK